MKSGTTDHIFYDVYVKLLEKKCRLRKHADNCLGLKNTELLEVMKCPKTGLGWFTYDINLFKKLIIYFVSATTDMLNTQRKLTNYFLTNVHAKYKKAELTRRKAGRTAEAGILRKALNPSLDKLRCALCSSAPESAPRGWQQHDNQNASCQIPCMPQPPFLNVKVLDTNSFLSYEHCDKRLNSSRLSFPASNVITRGKIYLSQKLIHQHTTNLPSPPHPSSLRAYPFRTTRQAVSACRVLTV